MKKLIVYIIFVLCLFSITGCTRFSPSSPNETPSENNADIQQLSPNVSAETTPVQTDSNEYIGEETAEAAALEHANISETDVKDTVYIMFRMCRVCNSFCIRTFFGNLFYLQI